MLRPFAIPTVFSFVFLVTPAALAQNAGMSPGTLALLGELGALLAPPEPTQPTQPLQQAYPAFGEDHKRTWELPAVVVEGEPANGLREEDLVGPYEQPRWTTTRRFPTTRVYVVPEGKVEVEAWARATINRDSQGGGTDWRFLQEFEIGLPNRFQFDFYLRQDYSSSSDSTMGGAMFEVRWALADWNEIWGNPTLYLEYITLAGEPDKIEPKLLLGGELGEGWHWGTNFVFEWQLSGDREAEYALTTALSKAVIDEKFSLGVESVLSLTDTKGSRGDFSTSYVIGPSMQWRPVPAATVNFAPLVGVTGDSPTAQIYFNAGWEF